MRLPSIKQFRAFLLVAETGSVSVAARSLGLTQPAVSQQLRELERTLSVRLFERANGRSIPTAAGQSLVEPARRALAAAEDAVVLAAETRQGDSGQIRIGSGATGCIHLLPSVLGAVKRAMPRLSLKVTIGDTADLVPQVQAGDLDIGLMTLPRGTVPSLTYIPLFSEPLMAMLPERAGTYPKGIMPQQLAQLPFIAYRAAGDTRTITDAWFHASEVAVTPIMELGSFEAIKVLVGAGLGAAIVPKLALLTPTPGAVSHNLNPPLSRTVGYVVRDDKIVDRGFRLLIRHLEAFPVP
ncbi:transcriptional regulator, LysR family [Arboricoccus pini]|uniref:Transcriptional regulator, LysR family n=1 Tax=Arboricoccus pini TaxID=1963835 RepID=A0A212RFI7_9PROT|nr:LysR family transcriptional regulator [Arboricoccus pini]SNB70983.1 transcriptional regulator, LysR family [Arboricoccus pini]